jgi:hypothetical protein
METNRGLNTEAGGSELTVGETEASRDCRKRNSLFEEIELEWFFRGEYPD